MAGIAALSFWAQSQLNNPLLGQQEEAAIFSVRPGENFISIGHRLEAQGYIRDKRFMRWYLNLLRKGDLPKRGDYQLANKSLKEIIDIIVSGQSVAFRFTIPEGFNMFQIASALEEQDLLPASLFVEKVLDKNFIARLQLPTQPGNIESLEGYLYPDTYHFLKEQSAEEIVRTMVDRFKEIYKEVEPKIKASATVQELKLTPHQIIILASITEKETGAGFERPIISSVWINRLRKRMRLQSDPTIIYGMWRRDGYFNGNIRKSDILDRTAYNTYAINGLPKGPIANPGLNAIESVLNPAETKYIYFVSKNDGTHVFNSSIRGHNQAVSEYQKSAHKRRGRSWRDLPKEKRANQ